MQLGVIGWAFATRPTNPVPSFASGQNSPSPGLALNTNTNPLSQPDLTRNPFDEPPSTLTTTPAPLVQPKPTPVPQGTPIAEPINRFEEAMLQGRTLRDRGDLGSAITKFREAAAMEPKNPAVYAELAGTYEKMNSMDKAAENWRKIYDMGPSAGIYYNLAETKLKVQQALETTKVMPTGPDLSQPLEGFAVGATLGLGDVRIEDQHDDGSAKRFVLHIPIKARPQTKMEVRDLVIHVLFYDIVDGQNVVQTSADVRSNWVSAPADWTEGDTEELAVEYKLPKPEAKAAKKENRKYFGYLVRIYYKQQLQAAAAEPERLGQQYPPPPTLPKDPDK
jgi:tetratricopeptide (TPR) repeat protein